MVAALRPGDQALSAHNQLVPIWKLAAFDDIDDGFQASFLRLCHELWRSPFLV